jgi:uncharacterized protein (DUF486 family)
MKTVLLLIGSNLFMCAAWYGHLRFPHAVMWKVILAAWGVAFFEYCLQVPANRMGYARFSAYELRIIQEVISLVVFSGFVLVWLKELPRWNHLAAFALIIIAVALTFYKPLQGH